MGKYPQDKDIPGNYILRIGISFLKKIKYPLSLSLYPVRILSEDPALSNRAAAFELAVEELAFEFGGASSVLSCSNDFATSGGRLGRLRAGGRLSAGCFFASSSASSLMRLVSAVFFSRSSS